MCGRFSLHSSADDIARHFALAHTPILTPHYNITPGIDLPIVRGEAQELEWCRWGLLPGWLKDINGRGQINARSDTVDQKPYFRAAFKKRRCLVMANGWYEWQQQGNYKIPYYFSLKSGGVFAFAGIWEHWGDGMERIESFAILTVEANRLASTVHARMPVIIFPQDYTTWLAAKITTRAPLENVLMACADDQLQCIPVSTKMNNPKHDDLSCIQAVVT